jgi:galactokinase
LANLLLGIVRDNIKVIRSPFRICPLGAHIDHQGGKVTGMALEEGIDLQFIPNEQGYVRIQSLDFPDEEYFHIEKVPDRLPGFWGNYIRGAVLALSQKVKLTRGITGTIRGKLPIGGLSSSAAVTTAYLMALCAVNDLDLPKEELIRLSHWVETRFIGLKNGILDQSANILSRENHLLVMDCLTEQYELIPSPPTMPDFEVVIVYSGVQKALISTDYNNRVDECKVAAWLLQELSENKVSAFQDVKLRDVKEHVYHQYADRLPGRFARRAKHYFSEMARVRQGAEAWKKGDLRTFGQLMFESGESSMLQYECGCPELITIFKLLQECPGVYGARFSGAGYRGCCIGLVDPRYKEQIRETIEAEYPLRHPQYKDVFKVIFCRTGDGARMVHPEQMGD